MALTETSVLGEPKTKQSNGINGVHKTHHGAGALANETANHQTTNGINKHDSSTHAPRRIAICGMAMRLPGGIRNSESFWDVLINGRDTRGPIPSDRYNSDGFSDRMSAKGAIKTQHGYFLEEDLACLDTSFFTMTRNELERMDPQQRQLLEVTRECLENAGEVDYRGKLVGCYVGTFGDDWLQMSAKEPQHSGGYVMTGHGDLMIANRVSFEYDFRGPSMVIKTGCSASLVALHEACRALQSGDCTSAVVAGTNLILGPTTTAAMTSEGILSPDGSCKTFDAAANGFARAEAITAIYLKPVDSAIQDNNPIRAVIRNTGTNSDGRSASLMSPNGESHEMLMRKVYADMGLDPRETAFVECHGTGTPTGDPIETSAVANVFGEEGIYIGSVKPNMGHSEGASGITSLIKCILALEKRLIPPNIKFINPNPKIPGLGTVLKVPKEATKWPAGRKPRISINSFGIGGANAHVILESLHDEGTSSNGFHLPEQEQTLMIFSANTQESLNRYMGQGRAYVQQHQSRLAQVASTLALHREHLPYRAFTVIDENLTYVDSPVAKILGSLPSIQMVFSGQGAQWARMGAELCSNDFKFSKDIEAMDEVLRHLQHPPSWRIQDELLRSKVDSRLDSAEFSQPICTALQIAIVNKLNRCKVNTEAVIGHSSGEIAAAYAAGVFSMPAAMILAYYRGFVAKQQRRAGAMAAIGLDPATVSSILEDGVVIACENSPKSVTISGDRDAVLATVDKVKRERPDALARPLKVKVAYHSDHMKDVAEEYLRLIETEFSKKGITLQDPSVPFYSSVTQNVIRTAKQLGPIYWKTNMVSPVLFAPALRKAMHDDSNRLFLEVGPHSTLAGPIRQIVGEMGSKYQYIPTMIRDQDCQKSLLSAFGQLYQTGLPLDLAALIPRSKVLSDFPTYPWDHGPEFWYESRISKDWRQRKIGHHPLLGIRVPESSDLNPLWRNVLSTEDEMWLHDHKIQQDTVFPFAGYCTMAGEAVLQITGDSAGYSLKHVVAHTALVLSDSKPVEMITTLSQHRLTDSANSHLWDFVIASHSGTSWVKHCEGRVCSLNQEAKSERREESLLRKVRPSLWYETMARTGIIYGPAFQGLTQIASSTTHNIANGTIVSLQRPGFLLHPSTIDAGLQLLLVAMARGVGRNFSDLKIPTMIEELDIWGSAPTLQATAWSSHGSDAGIECVSDGRLAMRLTGIRLTPLETEGAQLQIDKHAAARLEWRPHFDFADHSKLFTPPTSYTHETNLQEEMTLLCILDCEESLAHLTPKQEHFAKYRAWLSREADRARLGTYPVVEDVKRFMNLSHASRVAMIEDRYQQLSRMSNKDAVAEGIYRIWANAGAIFTGEGDTLDILTQDNVLTKIYNVVSFGHAGFIQVLSHTKPGLRIMEVGAGTGGTTQTFLHDLVTQDGHPRYSKYTFTDISAGFFPQARERFSYAPNMDFQVFDISQDPLKQGFEPQSYDLILAPNVVHATARLRDTLQNLQCLLTRGGRLVLTELSAVVRTPNYIFGNFSGWWLGEEDGRPHEPYVSVERWDLELKAAGFTGVETAVYDAEEPYQYCAAIVSQPSITTNHSRGTKHVVVLCNQPAIGFGQLVSAKLQDSGYEVYQRSLDDLLPEGVDVVSVLDLETPFFQKISESRFASFQKMLRNIQGQKLLWLTKPSQISCTDPGRALSIGMARTIRSELNIPYFTLEIDSLDNSIGDLVSKMLAHVEASEDTESLLPDREYAVDQGEIKIGRYVPYSLKRQLGGSEAKSFNECSTKIQTLEITKPGLLESLEWRQTDRPKAIADGHVEVETRSIGLNFRDVVFAMGIIRSESETVPLGLEMAGVISRIGANSGDFKVGDRVMAISANGCITTRATIPSSLAVKLPEGLSFEAAATMPICFATAIRSLIDVGQVTHGQSVLIHSAAGGVGHAAIQICKLLGAEIFVTAGNEEKIRYLTDCMGIPRSHIFDSRSEGFVSGLMAQTGGRGVDLVLNSLSGELLHASWRCVAKFGRMIELGKRDLMEHGHLDMQMFLANRSYCCVDIAQLAQERPIVIKSLLERCIELCQQGRLEPIATVKVFQAAESTEAFRTLQKGSMIGKAVIQIPDPFPSNLCESDISSLNFDPEASYLLTGGLGGLGKPIATWMVERNARSLIFLSRSAGQSDEDKLFFRELESQGCSALAIKGEVQNIDCVQKAIAVAKKPIRGVIHLAMVLRDGPIVDMSYADWAAAIAPKVDGAWNLHQAFLGQPLDFFLLASSLVTIVDQPGQGNYNASNTFLEAFCQYRHSLSLPASVLNICPIEGIGFVAETPQARRNLKAQGLYFLGEKELLDYITSCVRYMRVFEQKADPVVEAGSSWHNPGQLIMGLRSEVPLQDPNNRTNWRRDRRMAIYHNFSLEATATVSQNEANEFQTFLKSVKDDPELLKTQSSQTFLAAEIGRKIYSFMLRSTEGEDIDISLSLNQIGLDSLMAIELRRWWKQAFGLDISVLEIMGSGSLEQLGKIAAQSLGEKLSSAG